mmetsp:Transcript_13341/g.22814  ORF Transcript_13341/g.22814 Transcript_13341/m.22814 type:complete len:579 (-) Transcript_13341:288-2024(-)|eukprot:CAMPEP_0184700038 /NCGR_PEP_ID=MMETSP0313-20130426/7736_1 /TAXON_ID=2792 /ORGANISM="Porphyridium aerugineum, Strain SAG 1380-2" /LENGTH=578 /DNA_ID=CAMNT_0027159391 /DNA_START=87 /DNA_END=1823 /DNA_ORIENTATION=-
MEKPRPASAQSLSVDEYALCTNCDKAIPRANMALHEVYCAGGRSNTNNSRRRDAGGVSTTVPTTATTSASSSGVNLNANLRASPVPAASSSFAISGNRLDVNVDILEQQSRGVPMQNEGGTEMECVKCTYLNPPGLEECEICGSLLIQTRDEGVGHGHSQGAHTRDSQRVAPRTATAASAGGPQPSLAFANVPLVAAPGTNAQNASSSRTSLDQIPRASASASASQLQPHAAVASQLRQRRPAPDTLAAAPTRATEAQPQLLASSLGQVQVPVPGPGPAPVPSARPAPPVETQGTGWRCSRCTYADNVETSSRCEMCAYTREVSSSSSRRNSSRNTAGRRPNQNAMDEETADVLGSAALGAVLGGLSGALISSMFRDPEESSFSAIGRGVSGGMLVGAALGGFSSVLTNEMESVENAPNLSGGNTRNQSMRRSNSANRAQPNRRQAEEPQTVTVLDSGDFFQDTYERLMEMFPPASGPRRPANRDTIQALPVQVISTQEELDQLDPSRFEVAGSASSTTGEASPATTAHKPSCPICLMEFVVGDTIKRLPCLHVFHNNCIERWLVQSSSCPVCTHDVM